MTGNYLIVTPTWSRVAKYCNRVLPLLDAFWPDHPPTIILSDHDNLDAKHIFVKRSNNWLDILYSGLLAIKSSNPAITHLLLMLDDHYPLRSCDQSLISANYAAVVKHGLACVSFVTYAWPWTITEHREYPD